ncbi:5-formyltetrahydrofolate cyclo-ligase [Pacificimonas sp. WHA3]|uniref:5-formyltetrahydrofolate cyclo-ligase n=1 Tax=Pacificimonas pallii TaxID=2827236 RepID=A0ABS6SE20_9SPHN|nr:5-formyltetrahydrofolate cyclo-ligase [Pacificimonas pallii]MBV7256655.1 5-formyltetrahydrofolate cyclo-ligase [Pacificimonas pallii]
MHDLSAKDRLRRDLRAARAAHVGGLSDTGRRAAEQAVAEQIQDVVAAASCLGSYAPMGHEINPAAIEERGKGVIALPWFSNRASPMMFRNVTGALEPGPWGVMQPPSRAAPSRPDVLLVPLVGATPAGDRLGQGQGHFDRCISALRGEGPLTTIGLAWDCQMVEEVPTDTWDEMLDMIATPTRLYARA